MTPLTLRGDLAPQQFVLTTTYSEKNPAPTAPGRCSRKRCQATALQNLLLISLFVISAHTSPAAEPGTITSLQTDLLIVGGTESGWAAAIQAARMGIDSITIVHDGTWLGGQFTEQALACVDENKGVSKVGWGPDWHPMKRSFYRSGLFAELMDRIESFNTEKYGSPMPGRPIHGPSTFRPAEAEAVFRAMLQPYIDSGQVRFITNRYPVNADVDRSGRHPRLTGLRFAPTEPLCADPVPVLHVTAAMTIDASDWGDAIQVSGAAYECGPDPRSRYDEPSAPEHLSNNPPNEMNPITWAMIVEKSGSAQMPIAKPKHYDDRNYPRVSKLSFEAMGRNLEWDRTLQRYGGILHWPPGGAEATSPRQLSVFTVRRIVDGHTSKDGKTSILLNYMNGQDYPLERLPRRVADALEATEPGASTKNIVEMTRPQRQIIFEDAKQHALGVLYHLQTFVHDRADDTTNSFRTFRLSTEFGTPDHLPPKPYIRESLRLKAMYMMREQDGRNRDGDTKEKAKERFAHVLYPDGLFAWQFHYDFHRTGRTYLFSEGDTGPWIDYEKPGRHTRFMSDRSVFPLRSLVPQKMDGLLGAQKNVGYSSIVSAAIRLHDQCIHIGQAAGATAAVSLKRNVAPRAIPYHRLLLEEVRSGLCGERMAGVPLLLWPFRDLDPAGPDFVAINRLAALGALTIDPQEVDFKPDSPADRQWIMAILKGNNTSRIEPGSMTRGAFCRDWWRTRMQSGGAFPGFDFVSIDRGDADGDGIPDRDDALLFTRNTPVAWEIQTPPPPPPTEDGLVNFEKLPASVRLFDFAGKLAPQTAKFIRASGGAFDQNTGFGWARDVSDNHRQRNAVPEHYRDTFLFTRTEDTWECRVDEPGTYRVTVCVGDSATDQPGQNVAIEGKPVIENAATAEGHFLERTADVEITDGRLTITIGRPGGEKANTCLNWLVFWKVES